VKSMKVKILASPLRMAAFALVALTGSAVAANAQRTAGPSPVPLPPATAAPQDVPFPGVIRLAVDATDTDQGIFRVHETIPVSHPGPMILLYPKWLPGDHGPTGPIDKLAGLTIRSGTLRLNWTRDAIDVYAFHVEVPTGIKALDLEFQFLSPVESKEGHIMMTQEMLDLEWNTVVLYPAGYFSGQIVVQTSVKLPSGWKFGTGLERASDAGAAPNFTAVSLETLIDSPLVAGRYFARVDLNPKAPVPVHMSIVADRPDELTMTPAQLLAHRNLVQQAYKLFDSRHYDHYEFLVVLSDRMLVNTGLEHHRSSEDPTIAKYFMDWDKTTEARDLLPHEYVHSWNGKFRRPADLWTPNFNVPMRNSLLWVYEGQTQYWGNVLAARSGLRSKQQALDEMAWNAAFMDHRIGRQWRPLEDTTADPISTLRRPIPWKSWQRSEDYYDEGQLVWLDADTLIREKTGGKKSLDDFARAFFGINDGGSITSTYTLADLVKALSDVLPYDWAGFLKVRINAIAPTPLEGLKRGGYRLVYTDKASDFFKSNEEINKTTDLYYSLGIILDKDSTVTAVLWDGPAFNAGLTVGNTVVAVNGTEYDADGLKDAIKKAKESPTPIELLIKRGDQYRTIAVDYHGGLRYPHLERILSTPALLDDVLSPR